MKNPDSTENLEPNNFPVDNGCWPARVDHGWQNQIILKYIPLVKAIAYKLALRLPGCIIFDELVSSGIMGLIDAIHKFDPDKNPDFKAYAEYRIIGAILDELRSLDWIPRSVRKKQRLYENAREELQRRLGRAVETEEVAELWNMSMEEFHAFLGEINPGGTQSLTDDFLETFRGSDGHSEMDTLPRILTDGDNGDPLAVLDSDRTKKILFQSIEDLPDLLQAVVKQYYFEEITMTEIGARIERTQSRISQLHRDAITQLRLMIAPKLGTWEIIGKPIPIMANRKNGSGDRKHRRTRSIS